MSFDRVGRIEEANLMATSLLARPRHLLIGSPFAVHVAREDTDLFLRHLWRCRSSEARVDTELRLRRRDGQVLFSHVSSTPTTSSIRNGARLYQTAIVDLTEQKQAQEALRESEELHRAMVAQTGVGMARTSLKGRLAFVNKRLCEMLGYEEHELLGKSIADITHPDDLAETRRSFRRITRSGEPYSLRKRYTRKNGSILWANLSVSPLLDVHGKPQSAIGVVVDINAQVKAEAALEESKQMLEKLVEQRTRALRAANTELEAEIKQRQGLESEIMIVADREQQRLGQELHDSLCQQLSAIGMMTRAVALRLKNHRVIEVEDLEKITQLINNSIKDARDIARDLHKEEIDAASFTKALRDLAERKIWSTPCQLSLKTVPRIEDDTVASELYRILREALINANKHAQASQIMLEVCQSKNELIFSVIDNGIGLTKKRTRTSGLGFHIMNYRTKAIGARLEVKSPPNGGTRVTVYLPHST